MTHYTYTPVKKSDTVSISSAESHKIIEGFKNNSVLETIIGMQTKEILYTDISALPHMLVGGATGSGKSNFITSLLTCLISKNTPSDLSVVLIDPKMVEFAAYKDIPHLYTKIGSGAHDCYVALSKVHTLTTSRYATFKKEKVKNISEYRSKHSDMPYVLVIIDEIADILHDNKELKDLLISTAQISRAAGIHFILATQRPSSDIIDGRIKANFPARVAFKCASMQDSMIVLGAPGAEKLRRAGEFLYKESSLEDIIHAKSLWISPEYTQSILDKLSTLVNENIQQMVCDISDVILSDCDVLMHDSSTKLSDAKASIYHIMSNGSRINKEELKRVILSGEVIDVLLNDLRRFNLINSDGELNRSALSVIMKSWK